MITFTDSDINLPAIMEVSQLGKVMTSKKYHVYGLRQAENSVILFETNEDEIKEKILDRIDILKKFFKKHSIEFETMHNDDFGGNEIHIGLRRDVREIVNSEKKPLFISALLSTIIYFMEGKINKRDLMRFKMPTFPRMPFNSSTRSNDNEDVD